VLCNRKRGPSFLLAVLSDLHENAERVEDVMIINNAAIAANWGNCN